eukprot:jgi/Chlat1/4961/Chrsp32S00379
MLTPCFVYTLLQGSQFAKLGGSVVGGADGGIGVAGLVGRFHLACALPASGLEVVSFRRGDSVPMVRPSSPWRLKQFITRAALASLAVTALIYFTSTKSTKPSAVNVFSAAPRKLTQAGPLEAGKVYRVLVTGGAGYIGSHASLRLLNDGHFVTIVDNLSRGNLGAVKALEKYAKKDQLNFVLADLGDPVAMHKLFTQNTFDLVLHFAAVAYVGESMAEPLRYYHNITSNTMQLLEHMSAAGVSRIIYSSTCATYGEPEKMPITEDTPQNPINPYGKAKKMAEDIIHDYSRTIEGFQAVILSVYAGYSVKQFVDACLKATQAAIKVREVKERRPGDYAEVYSDPSKIFREVGWKAQYTNLEESLKMAWSWQKAHNGVYDL